MILQCILTVRPYRKEKRPTYRKIPIYRESYWTWVYTFLSFFFLFIKFKGPNSRILATGGGSQNKTILQVLSSVFNLPVFGLPSTANATCIGCIYRCKQAALGGSKDDFFEAVKNVPPLKLLCQPNKDDVLVYNHLLSRYKVFEQSITESN